MKRLYKIKTFSASLHHTFYFEDYTSNFALVELETLRKDFLSFENVFSQLDVCKGSYLDAPFSVNLSLSEDDTKCHITCRVSDKEFCIYVSLPFFVYSYFCSQIEIISSTELTADELSNKQIESFQKSPDFALLTKYFKSQAEAVADRLAFLNEEIAD